MAHEALFRVLGALERRGGAVSVSDLSLALFEEDGYQLVSSWARPEDGRKFEKDLQNWDEFQRSIAGLRGNLGLFASDAFSDRLCQPMADIDLGRAHAQNQIVYFELNAQLRPEAAAAVARLVFEDLTALAGTLSSAPERKKPYHVYLDEAGRAVYRGLGELISLCRSAEIGLVLASQSPRDFNTGTPPVKDQVLQNTATKVILRQPDPESAELCAQLGGTREVVKRTYQRVDGGLVLGVKSSGVYSDRVVHEFIVHPSVLKNIGGGSGLSHQADGRATGGPDAAFGREAPRDFHSSAEARRRLRSGRQTRSRARETAREGTWTWA
jgi:hypothetical protein